jgi:phage tail sheath protein FI
MPTYLSPGVYVEEVESGSRPIEGVGTAVAAFVGFAAQGPVNTPTLVSNWSQFTNTFGDFTDGCYLAHAVYGYFSNGGGNCYVVRVGGDNGAGAAGEIAAAPQATLGRYRVAAKPAAIGDGRARSGDLTVEVVPNDGAEAADDTFTLLVKRGDKVEETFPGDDRGSTQQAGQVIQAFAHVRDRP